MTVRHVLSAAVVMMFASGTPAISAEIDGASAPLGQASVKSYARLADDGRPLEIGISLASGSLSGLPPTRNQTSRCADMNLSGKIDAGECEGDYQVNLPFPSDIAGRADIPFTFAMVNWNPEGHAPAPWAPPHFDIHFYQIPIKDVEGIKLGTCGIFMDCADFERAMKPVAARYVHADHVNVKAAVGQMGNHLIDSKTPEFGTPPKPFTHTWIFGAFDGRIIFHEVMATRSFMTLGGDACGAIKQPAAWADAGWYPTRYCFRHTSSGALEVFMDSFVKREAS